MKRSVRLDGSLPHPLGSSRPQTSVGRTTGSAPRWSRAWLILVLACTTALVGGCSDSQEGASGQAAQDQDDARAEAEDEAVEEMRARLSPGLAAMEGTGRLRLRIDQKRNLVYGETADGCRFYSLVGDTPRCLPADASDEEVDRHLTVASRDEGGLVIVQE